MSHTQTEPLLIRSEAARATLVSSITARCSLRTSSRHGRFSYMRSTIAVKVISAAAGTLALELADLALDKAGVSEQKAPFIRRP